MTMLSKTVFAFVFGAAACQQQPQTPKEAPQAEQKQGQEMAKELLAQFAAEKIDIDLAKGTVTVAAFMNEPPDPIEYLLIHRHGKRHEAMFVTKSKPSILNAALLLLGLQPGKNATYKDREPAPTPEEMEKGVDPLIVTPPEGTQLWMTVRWTEESGVEREYCVEDLLADLSAGEAVRDASFIYLGGRMASIYKNEPEVFVADMEGNLVSVCYLTPDNHLATMRHARARDDQNWWLTDKVPKPGTEVKFTFHRQEPPMHKEREARLREEAAKKPADKAGEKPGDDKKPADKDAEKPAGGR